MKTNIRRSSRAFEVRPNKEYYTLTSVNRTDGAVSNNTRKLPLPTRLSMETLCHLFRTTSKTDNISYLFYALLGFLLDKKHIEFIKLIKAFIASLISLFSIAHLMYIVLTYGILTKSHRNIQFVLYSFLSFQLSRGS